MVLISHLAHPRKYETQVKFTFMTTHHVPFVTAYRKVFSSDKFIALFFTAALCLKSLSFKILVMFVLVSFQAAFLFAEIELDAHSEWMLFRENKKGVSTISSPCLPFVVSINGHLKASECPIFVWFLSNPSQDKNKKREKSKLTIQSYCTRV